MPAVTFLRLVHLISLVLSGQAEPPAAPPRPANPTAAAPNFRAQLHDGRIVSGTVQLKNGMGTFRPADGSANLNMRDVLILRSSTAAETTRQRGPRWQFHLGGGERFTGELLESVASGPNGSNPATLPKSDPQTPRLPSPKEAKQDLSAAFVLPLLFRGETQASISSERLMSLLAPRNERLLVYRDFEEPAADWTIAGQPAPPEGGEHLSGTRSLRVPSTSEPLIYRPATFPRVVRMQWQLHEPAPLNTESGWRIVFQLVDPSSESKASSEKSERPWRWVVQTAGRSYSSVAPVEGRFSTLPVKRQAGWRQWMLLLTEDQTLLCVDGQVLATGQALPRRLASLGIQGLRGGTLPVDDRTAPRVDDFLLTEPSSVGEAAVPRNSQLRALAWLATGDEIFGTVTQLSSRSVTLATLNKTKRIPAEDLAGVVWPVSAGGADGESTRGWHAWVELTDGLWSRMREPDRLCLALQNFEADRLVADHSVLGRLRLPLREIRRIEPLFSGERRVLAAGPVHLGDEARPGFAVPLPAGTWLERTVILDRLPPGKCFCSLLVEDMEPSGPHTPESSSHLATLQAGHLQTRLLINGHLVGDLNQHISQCAKPGQPIRLRMPLALGLLQPGKNVLRLQQQSAADDPQNFDDCQISQWGLEWEQGE